MSGKIKIQDAEMTAILAEVEAELTGQLTKAQADIRKSLAKADGEEVEESAPEESAPGEASPAGGEGEESAPAPEASASAASPEESVAPAEGSAPPAEASAPGPDAAGADPVADQGVDPQALAQEYAALPDDQLQAHYMACKQAMFQRMQQGQGGAPGGDPAGAPPAGPEQSAPPPALKSEGKQMPVPKANGENPLDKNERAELDELRKANELLVRATELALGTPIRKAVTSMAYIAKSEDGKKEKALSKAEIDQKLKAKIRTSLQKSDRTLINDFYDGRVGVEKIQHLLKD